MRKLVLLLVLGLAVSAQAGILVPNGEFGMIKWGEPTITGTLPEGNNWLAGVGPDTVLNGGIVEFSDGTTGTATNVPGVVEVPGWVNEVGGCNIFDPSHTPGDTSSYNAFGPGWGGGTTCVSAAPLVRPASPGGDYEVSAWVMSEDWAYVDKVILDLMVGGVVITPTSETIPVWPAGEWARVSKTYASLDAGDVTIRIGTPSEDCTGGRLRIDDVCFTPEPATMTLLGLGGLALLRRRK